MTKRELLARLAPYGMDDEVHARHWDDDEMAPHPPIRYGIEDVDESPQGPVLVLYEEDESDDDDDGEK
jgi:hypothetical protein